MFLHLRRKANTFKRNFLTEYTHLPRRGRYGLAVEITDFRSLSSKDLPSEKDKVELFSHHENIHITARNHFQEPQFELENRAIFHCTNTFFRQKAQVCQSLNVHMYNTEKALMTTAMTQNAFDQPHCCIKHHSMPLNGNQAQQRSYYMGYSTPAFISSNRKTSKKIKIRK